MKKILVIMFMVLLCACSSDIISESHIEKAENIQNYDTLVFTVNCDSLGEKLVSLDSMQTLEVPMNVISSKKTRGVITPVIGTITNLGNNKTMWVYGLGENLVPRYYCGTDLRDMTISACYKVSVRYDLNEDYVVKGYTGKKSGWSGAYVKNKQEKWQGQKGDTSYQEFYTYAYNILSKVSGVHTGKDCWVPCQVDSIRIYVKIMQ